MSNEWPLIQESDEEYIYNIVLNDIEMDSAKYGTSYIQSYWEFTSTQMNTKVFTLFEHLQMFASAGFNPVILNIMNQICDIHCISSLISGGSVSPSYVDVRINNVTITNENFLKKLIDISLGTLEVIWKVCKLDDHAEVNVDDPKSTFIPKVLKRLSLSQDTPVKKLPVAVKIFLKSKLWSEAANNAVLISALQKTGAVLDGHQIEYPDNADRSFFSLDSHILQWKTYVSPMKNVVPLLEWSSMVIQGTNMKVKHELIRELNLNAYQDRFPDYADIDLLPNVSNPVNYQDLKFVYNPYISLMHEEEKDV